MLLSGVNTDIESKCYCRGGGGGGELRHYVL